MKKCKKCNFPNLDGTNYCRKCGNYLNAKREKFIRKGNFGFWAGNGWKETSIAPLAVMGLEKKSQTDADLQKISKKKHEKVIPLENGDWYCPDCGEYNQPHTFYCKSCGREFGAS